MTTPTSATVAGRERWTAELCRVRQRPLRFCPELPAIAERWEAWWRFKAPRPLLLAGVPTSTAIRWGKCFDLLDRPQDWLRARRAQIENTYYVGDTIPFLRVELGPVSPAAFLGAPLHFSPLDETSWQDTTLEDWASPPSFRLDPANRWFRKVVELTRLAAQDGAGNYTVGTPDLAGSLDVLANLRGPDWLCMDLFDNREAVKQAAMEVVETFDAVFAAIHSECLSRGAGLTHWMGCWSDLPQTAPTCDFNALVGHEDFVEVCLPSILEQSRRAGRSVFHLDGPAAARHAEVLAAQPAITAIQYVPGAATPSTAAKLDMLKKIQAAGKPLWLYCPPEETATLCGELDPRGLALCPVGVASPRAADELMKIVERAAA